MMCVSRAHCNMTLLLRHVAVQTRDVKKAVFVTVPGLQRTMSGREDAPKLLMLRCARDTQLTHLFLDRPLAGAVRLVIARDDFAARPVDCGGGAQCLCSGACIK